MRSLRTLLVALAVAPALAACSTVSRAPAPIADSGGPVLDVQNLQSRYVTLYVMQGERKVRVGSVGGFGHTTVEIPGYLRRPGAALRLAGDPAGSGGMFEMAPVTIEGRNYLRWEISRNVAASSLSAYALPANAPELAAR